MLFSLTIHPLLESLKSDLAIGYLDDLTLGGDQAVVADDVRRIVDDGGALGLSLNISKCKLVSQRLTFVSDPLLLSFNRLEEAEVSLLGAPLFQGDSLDRAWVDRCDDMARAVTRLKDIASQ